MNPFKLTHRDGRLFFPSAYWFVERLKASWANKHWVTREGFDEIRRGNFNMGEDKVIVLQKVNPPFVGQPCLSRQTKGEP